MTHKVMTHNKFRAPSSYGWLLLKNSPAKWWGLAVALCGSIIGVIGLNSGDGTWNDTSVWMALPFVYAVALAACGTYLSARRMDAGDRALEATATRPKWHINAVRLLVTVASCFVIPSLIVAAVIWVCSLLGRTAGGRLDWSYYLAGLIFFGAVCVLAFGIARFARSTIGGLVCSVLGALLLSLYATPVPPVTQTWLSANGYRILLSALILVVSSGWVLFMRSVHGGFRWLVSAVIAVALVASLLGMGGIQRSLYRSAPREVCSDRDGISVCVWPGDERYVKEIRSIFRGTSDLVAALGLENKYTRVAEPGLPSSGESFVIEPAGSGDGMWYTAVTGISSDIVSEALDDAPVCNMDQWSTERKQAYVLDSWVLGDAVTAYISGRPRPDSVTVFDAEVSAALKKRIPAMLKLSRPEQVRWIKDRIEEYKSCQISTQQ